MKNYIGSQQHWEDSINDDYDERERHNKEQDNQQQDDREQEDNREQPTFFDYSAYALANGDNAYYKQFDGLTPEEIELRNPTFPIVMNQYFSYK